MKKERLTPVAGQLYTHNRRNAFQSRSYYTVKFTRFTDGRSAWCFLMSNATRILYGGKDKEFPRKSFTCEPFFLLFSYFFVCKVRVFRAIWRDDNWFICWFKLVHAGICGVFYHWNTDVGDETDFFITSIFIKTVINLRQLYD